MADLSAPAADPDRAGRPRPAAHPIGRRAERGFMMAMLLVFVVIMGVLLLKAAPYAKADVMRDREAELVFRGEAIARAIRMYQVRTGRLPVSLEELLTVRPRILRRLYKDPMTPEGEWRRIYAVQPGASGDTTGLPLVGVASRSDENSYRVYKGKTLYSDWVFTAMEQSLPGLPAGALAPTPTPTPKAVETMGGRK